MKKKSLDEFIGTAEDLVCGLFILTLAVVPVFEIIVRKVTGSGLTWSAGLLTHIVVWIAWTGGMAASREGVHLSLSASGRSTASSVAETAVNMAFAVSSAAFLVWGFTPGEKIGVLPVRLILLILPAGYLSMSVRSLWRPHGKPSRWLVPGMLLGLLFSWAGVVSLLEAAWPDMPLSFYGSQDFFWSVFRWLRWPLIAVLIVLAIRGMPIYILLGGTALFLFSGNWGQSATLANEAYNQLTNTTIPAIPLFIVTGYLLSESSSGNRLVRFFRSFLGWMPGGLAVVAVVACAFFTTFTGASGVTILALGGLLAAVLTDSGDYGRDFSRGLITSSGSVGLLFPPALPIIMYAVTAQISIRDMFLGGLLPGILLVAVLSGMGIFRALRSHTKSRPPKSGNQPVSVSGNLGHLLMPASLLVLLLTGLISIWLTAVLFALYVVLLKLPGELPKAFIGALGDLLMPVILLLLYFSGLTTVVETAAVSVVYAFLLTLLSGEMNKDLIGRMLRRGVPVIGGVLVILAMAKGLSYFIVDAQVPLMLTAFFQEYVPSRFVFLILLNLALLIAGTLMDIYSAILVIAPLIVPLGAHYGVHPVQLGIIFLANLQLGYLTPPVGMNLFLSSYTFGEPMNRVYKQVLPFLLVLLLAVLLITYVPWFSLALLK